MSFKILIVATALLAPIQAETILGVTLFTRHGDRTSKHYKNYNLTNLGFQQNYNVGGDYRSIYLDSLSPKQILGISEDKAINSQLHASAPDQDVLLNTATAFLQGLYPPLKDLNAGSAIQTTNTGANVTSPLNGYQYVTVHGEDEEAPNTIWLKGDDECPAVSTSINSYKESAVFKQRNETTLSFYESFWNNLKDVYDYSQADLSYVNAYEIFDLLNVASIHNTSSANTISDEQLFKLRTLADSAEFALSYDANDYARSIGGQSFAGGILNQLDTIVSSKGKLKFSLLAGSYDTFLAFFGLSSLTSVSSDFYGLPDYASTMAFELFTSENVTSFPSTTDELRVRFLFRNGSNVGEEPRVFPLFGNSEDSLLYTDFVAKMKGFAITTPEKWCGVCKSDAPFCKSFSAQSTRVEGSGMSNTVAGVIGAMVTLGVVSIIAASAFFVRRRKPTANSMVQAPNEKGSVYSV